MWALQRWPPHPFNTNSTTNDIPLLASIQYPAWENTTAPEKGGRTANQECGQSPVGLSHTFSTPSPRLKYLSHRLHQPKLCSQPISSCELHVGGFFNRRRLFFRGYDGECFPSGGGDRAGEKDEWRWGWMYRHFRITQVHDCSPIKEQEL